jgi:hypothetical protein
MIKTHAQSAVITNIYLPFVVWIAIETIVTQTFKTAAMVTSNWFSGSSITIESA